MRPAERIRRIGHSVDVEMIGLAAVRQTGPICDLRIPPEPYQ